MARKRLRDVKPDEVVLVGQVDLSNEAEVSGNLDVRHLASGPGTQPDGTTQVPSEVAWHGDGTWKKPTASTPPPDPGGDGDGEDSGGSQTGDRLLYFHVGYGSSPDHVMTDLPAGDTDIGLGVQRHNLANAARYELQSDVRAAGSAAAKVGIKYDTSEAGPFTDWLSGSPTTGHIALAATGVKLITAPIPNAVRDLGFLYLKAYAAGGDAAADPAIRTLILRTIQGPRTDQDPGLGGVLICDLNARSLAQGEGSAINFWPDDSGDDKNGFPPGGQLGLVYRGSGFGGALGLVGVPYGHVESALDMVQCSSTYSGEETDYLLVDDLQGEGTALNSAVIWRTVAGSAQNGGVLMQGDGRFYCYAGASAFGTPQGVGTNAFDDGVPHMLRVVHNNGSGTFRLYVDGALEVSFSDALIVNGWTGPHQVGNPAAHPSQANTRLHRLQRWTAAHTASGLNAIEQAILSAAGL